MDRIESIQKQFLLFALRYLGFTGYRLPPYESRLLLLNMTTLESRREIQSVLLIFDLIRGNIDVDELSRRLVINDNPYSTRTRNYLIEERSRTDFGYNDIISRGIRNFNKHYKHYEPSLSKLTFKRKIEQEFKSLFTN